MHEKLKDVYILFKALLLKVPHSLFENERGTIQDKINKYAVKDTHIFVEIIQSSSSEDMYLRCLLGFTALTDWMNGGWLKNIIIIDVMAPLEKCEPLYSLDHNHKVLFLINLIFV